jgi:hypothetical protein
MKQKAGIAIFLFGVIWSLVWGLVISISCTTAINTMTLEQLNESVWSPTGPLMMLWGVGGVPLGTVIAGIGLLLYAKAKGLTTLFFALGVLVAIIVAMTSGSLEFYPFLFGIGGTIILLSFFGILWFWAKNRKDMEGQAAKAANLRLVAYVFFLNASWFTCGMGGQMMAKAFEGFDNSPPLHIMIFFVLGWVFLFLSHYQARKE